MKTTYTKRCPGCNEMFETSRSHATTCSNSCRSLVNRWRKAKPEDPAGLGVEVASMKKGGDISLPVIQRLSKYVISFSLPDILKSYGGQSNFFMSAYKRDGTLFGALFMKTDYSKMPVIPECIFVYPDADGSIGQKVIASEEVPKLFELRRA